MQSKSKLRKKSRSMTGLQAVFLCVAFSGSQVPAKSGSAWQAELQTQRSGGRGQGDERQMAEDVAGCRTQCPVRDIGAGQAPPSEGYLNLQVFLYWHKGIRQPVISIPRHNGTAEVDGLLPCKAREEFMAVL
jgi:hypothetical protein